MTRDTVNRTPMNVAIVGCGKIADAHVGELQKMNDVRIVGVCDLEPLMAEQIATRFGIEFYTDRIDDLLKREPDVVHVTTPPRSHLPLAKRAMEAGAHVYVEKPLAMNLTEVEHLLSTAEKNNRLVTVGHSFAFDPVALAMRRLIDKGVLGDPVHVDSWFGYNLAGPFGAAILADPQHWVHSLPGGLFHNNIDHMLNKISEFVPDDRPRMLVHAFTRRRERFGDDRDRLLDELRVTVGGERVTGSGVFTSAVQPVAQFARVYGTKNILHVDYNLRTVVIEKGVQLPSAIGRLLPEFGRGWAHHREGARNIFAFARSRFHFFAGMHELIRRFYGAIRGQEELPIPYRDMRRIAWMMDTIFERARSGEDGR